MCEFGRSTRCIIGAMVIVISLTGAQSEQRYKWTTMDWLQHLNYSHEVHNVTSADGYQLQLQRLPRVGARPVLLVHGLLGSSLGWLCLGPSKSLDAGEDAGADAAAQLQQAHQLLLIGHSQLLEIFNYDYLLQGGSTRELRHLQQIWKSGDFISYDYGPIENMQIYHSVEAINYNLSGISVPIILYFGQTDAIATPEGVHAIYAKMLNSVRSVRRISSAKFNHFDFLISGEVKTLVNDKLIELMEKFLDGKLPYIIE
ncbi:GH11314 [Drosophila grimshawi]|uniref:GH11314 n=1 Tax=Drosophila grimshawi TaxID=7222 RepID=B4JE63_DROGR|nr:GH11314 [Drosophila grimshawi]